MHDILKNYCEIHLNRCVDFLLKEKKFLTEGYFSVLLNLCVSIGILKGVEKMEGFGLNGREKELQ